jgi:hypothetical protein
MAKSKDEVVVEYEENNVLVAITDPSDERLKKHRSVCIVTRRDGKVVSNRQTNSARGIDALLKAKPAEETK